MDFDFLSKETDFLWLIWINETLSELPQPKLTSKAPLNLVNRHNPNTPNEIENGILGSKMDT